MNTPLIDRLDIVVATDNHYIILLAALIKSVEHHNEKKLPIHLYVIEDNVSGDSKKKLAASIDPTMTTLHWQPMDKVIPEGTLLPLDRSSYPLNIYMRLFIPFFIPKTIEKVLYLDVDMIAMRDVSEIFSSDLGDNIIAAVLDPRIITFDNSWGGILNYKELGFAPETRYFNTGLLLMDLPKWRAEDLTIKILNCIDNHKKFAFYPDQYGLNVILANKWFELNPKWNHFSTINPESQPFLIHFVERKPIYQSYNYNETFKKIFYGYLSQTEWKNFKPIGENLRYIKKLKNILNKVKKMF